MDGNFNKEVARLVTENVVSQCGTKCFYAPYGLFSLMQPENSSWLSVRVLFLKSLQTRNMS